MRISQSRSKTTGVVRHLTRAVSPLVVMLFVITGGCSGGNGGSAELREGFGAVELPDSLTVKTADLIIDGSANRDASVYLDLKTIMQYPAESFTSIDPWDGERHEYTGVPLYEMLYYFGIVDGADAVRVKAENGYEVDIRLGDMKKYGYLLAYKIDGQLTGETEGLTNRGDLMVAIDFDDEELDPEVRKHQLVWQVSRVVVQ